MRGRRSDIEVDSVNTNTKISGAKFVAYLLTALLATLVCVSPATARSNNGAYAPPVGIAVPVQLLTELSSASCNPGDRFDFETTKDATLGTLAVPKGSRGHGRVASVTRADDKHDGKIAIQVDSIDLADGTTVWVDMDPKSHVDAHLADKHTKLEVLEVATTYSGDMILTRGTTFDVLTIAPRRHEAALASSM